MARTVREVDEREPILETPQTAALRESEERFRAIFENAPIGIEQLDLDGRVVKANAKFCKTLGYREDELLQLNFADFTLPDDLVKERPLLESLFRGEIGSYSLEKRYLHKNGTPVWVRITSSLTGSGDNTWRISLIEDIGARKQAEAALRASEEQFRLLAETLPSLVWFSGPDGRVEYLNRQWYQYTGMMPEQDIGRVWPSLLHGDDRTVVLERWRESVTAGTPFEAEYRLRRGSDGMFRWFLCRALPMRNEQGRVIRWFGTCTDIDDQKRSQEELHEAAEQRRLALEAGNLGTWEFNLLTGTMDWSARGRQILGFDPHTDVNYATFLATLHPDDRQSTNQAMSRALDPAGDGKVLCEFRVIRPSGDIRWVTARGRIFFEQLDGARQAAKFVGIVLDITDRKRNEEASRQLAENLARSNKDLEQFAYVASHDLQEPLRQVTSFVQLLERHLGAHLDEAARDYMKFIVDGAARMHDLILDLLAYSRVGSGDSRIHPVDVQKVVDDVLGVLEAQIRKTGALISVEPMPTLRADKAQLAQVFQNLISNAIKFHGDRPPEIHVGCQRQHASWLFWVRDNGIGFSPEYADRIFQLFQRLHGRTQYPGTGIGLTICKRVVERHSGHIWAESAPGKGAAFCFVLPE